MLLDREARVAVLGLRGQGGSSSCFGGQGSSFVFGRRDHISLFLELIVTDFRSGGQGGSSRFLEVSVKTLLCCGGQNDSS